MATEIIANVDRLQTRVAIMQDARLMELKYEREEDVLGNIYLGKVTDAVPGLDACFMNVGIERNVFLHVSDALPEEPPRGRAAARHLPRIQDVVKSGDVFMVQVTKGPLDTKGARATRQLSLPGRFLVLTTGTDKVGVSKKIEDEVERRRLRDAAAKLRPEGFGLIVRTRAEGAKEEDLERDVAYLGKLWRAIESKVKQTKAPALIHQDISLVLEVVRDVFSASVDRFVIDHKVTYDQVLNLINNTAPHLRDRVHLYKGHQPVFEHYGVEKEIELALHPRVPLPHGGHLIIDTTEALTVIDVNSGKFIGASSLEKTVFQTNLDACEEVARQLRLRDIGGIIVVDFIDMDKTEHRREVTKALRAAFSEDRMRTRIMHITRLGLVEMTRKRTGVNLRDKMLGKCPCCGGLGRILSPETVAYRATNELRRRVPEDKAAAAHVLLDPQSALALVGEQGSEASALEKELNLTLFVRATHNIHPEVYELTLGDARQLSAEYPLPKVGEIVEVQPGNALHAEGGGLMALVEGCLLEVPEAPSSLEAPLSVRLTKVEHSYLRGTPAGSPGASAGPAAGKPSRSRRGRRGRGGKKAEGAPAETGAAEAPPAEPSPAE